MADSPSCMCSHGMTCMDRCFECYPPTAYEQTVHKTDRACAPLPPSPPAVRQSPQDDATEPTHEQRSLADQASVVAGYLLRTKHCRHERKCGCYGRHRVVSWLTLDALIHEGWTLTPPSSTDDGRHEP